MSVPPETVQPETAAQTSESGGSGGPQSEQQVREDVHASPDEVPEAGEVQEAQETGEAQEPGEAHEANESRNDSDADAGADSGNEYGNEAGNDSGNEADAGEEEYSGEAGEVGDEEVYKLKRHRRERSDAPAKSGERRRPRNARKNVREAEPEPEPEEEIDEATRERRALEARIDAALQPSSKKRKKLAGDDLEMMQDDVIAKLRDDMRNAALQDVESIGKGEPAVHKVRMLREVVQVLQKGSLADSILDGNLLESVRIWLEPLPDASLPSFEIQRELFSALITLPIKTIHLRESGLGRVVLFYQKSKRPQPAIKRMAQKLIGDWTRPIIGRSDNYRDKRVATASFDPRDARLARANPNAGPRSSYEESAARRNRAAIPSSSGISYQVAPVSGTAPEANAQGPAPKDSQLRRMKTKLMASGRAGRKKSQVSVEGRGLN